MTLILQDSVGNVVDFTVLTFSGGEEHIRLQQKRARGTGVFHITADLRSSADIMRLFLLTDAVRQQYSSNVPITLVCPYVPYARQDRACAVGEALSLRVMCNLLNSQGYESITVWDPHSDVAPALLHHVRVVSQEELVMRYLDRQPVEQRPKYAVVAPDAGATKKAFALAQRLKVPFVQGFKHRDVTTGNITGVTIEPVELPAQTALLVVDDICDGGRTFIELGKVLTDVYPRCTNHLYITHGIFTQGLAPLLEHYATILCPNPWPGITEQVTALAVQNRVLL